MIRLFTILLLFISSILSNGTNVAYAGWEATTKTTVSAKAAIRLLKGRLCGAGGIWEFDRKNSMVEYAGSQYSFKQHSNGTFTAAGTLYAIYKLSNGSYELYRSDYGIFVSVRKC